MLDAGDTIGGYTVVDTISSGGMGTVLHVRHANGADAAAKVIHPHLVADETMRKRFLREANLLWELKHPGIVELYQVAEERRRDDVLVFLVMELLQGGTLGSRLKGVLGKGIEWDDAAEGLVRQLLKALVFVHDRGVVHRDLKPSNVFLTVDGRLKLIDFGLAYVLERDGSRLTQHSNAMGTVGYLAPEMMMQPRPTDEKAALRKAMCGDVFSAGVCLYEVFGGEHPHWRSSCTPSGRLSTRLLAMNMVRSPVPNLGDLSRELPDGFVEFIARATAFAPQDRYADASGMLEDFERFACGDELEERAPRPPPPPAPPAPDTPARPARGYRVSPLPASKPQPSAKPAASVKPPPQSPPQPRAPIEELAMSKKHDPPTPVPVERPTKFKLPDLPAALGGGPATSGSTTGSFPTLGPTPAPETAGPAPVVKPPPTRKLGEGAGNVAQIYEQPVQASPMHVPEKRVACEGCGQTGTCDRCSGTGKVGKFGVPCGSCSGVGQCGVCGGSAQLVIPGFVMVQLPGGTFWMGSRNSEAGRGEDEPLHRVQIQRSFLIADKPVAQRLWTAVMGVNPSKNPGADHPVEFVSWDHAVEFCNRLSALEGLQPAYGLDTGDPRWDAQASGYRLPSEAEWEFAARGGEEFAYSGASDPMATAWSRDNADGYTQEMGRLQPNRFGLYDMSGNVWEWVWDWYSRYRGGNAADPAGPDRGRCRVMRGGCCTSGSASVRSAKRDSQSPNFVTRSLGFRIARNA